MQLTVKGRHMNVGESFRQHAEDALNTILEKYFGDAIEAQTTISKDRHLFRAALTIHVGRGILLQAEAEATEVYAAFDLAADKIAKRLRRYKRQLRDHHREEISEADKAFAQQYVLQAETGNAQAETLEEDLEEAPEEPLVVAEMETEIPNLTVSQAVMRMTLAESSAIMFRNRAHGGLNMIYRRNDGNIGWIDPHGNRIKS